MNINLDVDDIVENKDIDVPENDTSSGIFHLLPQLLPRQPTGTFYFIVKLHINDNRNTSKSIEIFWTIQVYQLGICKNHEETCGFQPTSPPKDHGKCWGRLIYKKTGLGGAGKCDLQFIWLEVF